MAVTWRVFREAEPGLAAAVQERFESHRHAVMATLRRDGAPRLSGMEAPIRDGHLWLAMDTGSRKTDDLRRDPRFSVHSAPDGEDLASGDARIEGRAVPALGRGGGSLRRRPSFPHRRSLDHGGVHGGHHPRGSCPCGGPVPGGDRMDAQRWTGDNPPALTVQVRAHALPPLHRRTYECPDSWARHRLVHNVPTTAGAGPPRRPGEREKPPSDATAGPQTVRKNDAPRVPENAKKGCPPGTRPKNSPPGDPRTRKTRSSPGTRERENRPRAGGSIRRAHPQPPPPQSSDASCQPPQGSAPT